jgi:hypothetical protein
MEDPEVRLAVVDRCQNEGGIPMEELAGAGVVTVVTV